MIEIKIIDTQEKIDALVLNSKYITQLGVDLEFDNNLHHYGFKLCLMQLFIDEKVYLIDPLKLNISPIFTLFEDDKIQKVVFSFGEDLRLLHSLGCKVRNIYDLATPVKLLNFEKISLSDIVREHLQINMEKGEQTSNWCARPLTDSQKKYAAADVVYLFELHHILVNLTKERRIEHWIEEENKALENTDNLAEIGNKIATKHRRNMNEVEWHYYVKLWEFREQLAKEFDKPSHQIINNNFLVELAQNPLMIKDWVNLKFMHHRLKTPPYFGKVKALQQKIELEIKEFDLRKENPALPKIDSEEYKQIKAKKIRIELIKEKYLKPVQDLIRRDYGEFAVTHILSNRLMDEIAAGEKTNFRQYRMQLVNKYLKELGLALPQLM